jgi:ABC-type polysaccharide/polyol phosphate transport system ATPase subunit
MSTVIKVENVSKQYRLGKVGTGTISHDINRWWHSIRGKEDPYLKIGETNNRTLKANTDYVWALHDINFDIEQGTVVGIIGRNGAGKSTMLKILSRTTAPTTGSVKIKGRVASLLEVGTGFHPELSGRENIYLNGAILGMTRREITRKFDEIVDFSGVDRYIDTPVKRYSSGMYVRLAFAVAAHLESEILIVDEVLAVGDAEFQKKCLGKMNDVSKRDGRTVLIVSHNISSIKGLCEMGILFQNGLVRDIGKINNVIDNYFFYDSKNQTGLRATLPTSVSGFFTRWGVLDSDGFCVNSDKIYTYFFDFESKKEIINCEIGMVIRSQDGTLILGCNSRDYGGDYFNTKMGKNIFKFQVKLPVIHGKYSVDIAIVAGGFVIDQWISETSLLVKNSFESVLSEKWRGILNIESEFRHV